MCKILGLFCMFLGCAFLGIGRAMEYKAREENSHYLVYILDCLISQIVYQRCTLEDCIFELSLKVREPYKACFEKIYTRIRENTKLSPTQIMEEEMRLLLQSLKINGDIAGLFIECFACTGFQDTEGMEKVLRGIKERLLEFREGDLEESRKQGRLAVYLGMFGGMFCVILCL